MCASLKLACTFPNPRLQASTRETQFLPFCLWTRVRQRSTRHPQWSLVFTTQALETCSPLFSFPGVEFAKTLACSAAACPWSSLSHFQYTHIALKEKLKQGEKWEEFAIHHHGFYYNVTPKAQPKRNTTRSPVPAPKSPATTMHYDSSY